MPAFVETKKLYRAFLFDMDGTIINSITAAERVWRVWAVNHGLDAEKFLPTIHGARSVDTIAKLGLPGLDPAAEAEAITQAEIVDVKGITEIAGAVPFLASLPKQNWAVVTSAPRALAIARLQAAGIPRPGVFITAEDVNIGKPHPQGYLLAARKLGVEIKDCLIFEDAAVGIRAGESAGADVMVITATHAHPIVTPHATIRDYEALGVEITGHGALRLTSKGS